MLNVINLLPVERTILEIDEYVPFKFRCVDYANAIPLYWRTGDFDTQLLQIGLNPESGVICSVTLTGFGSHIIKADQDRHNVVAGIPVCDRSMWINDGVNDDLKSHSV